MAVMRETACSKGAGVTFSMSVGDSGAKCDGDFLQVVDDCEKALRVSRFVVHDGLHAVGRQARENCEMFVGTFRDPTTSGGGSADGIPKRLEQKFRLAMAPLERA